MEKYYKREEIFKGKVVELVKDEVILDDGSHSYREVVHHIGGACIALEDQNGQLLMVKQYRYALESDMYEFCAGKLEVGEDPATTIVREAIEETGYEVKDVQYLGWISPSCGYTNEKIYLYHGYVGQFVGQDFDSEENIQIHRFTYDDINKMIEDHQIMDAKTICIMYHLNKRSK